MRVLSCLFLATLLGGVPVQLTAQAPGPDPSILAGTSPRRATELSVVSTLLGVALMPVMSSSQPPAQTIAGGVAATALIVGPSAGYYYGGMTMRGLGSTLVRTACAGAIAYGAVNLDLNVFDHTSGNGGAAALILVGGILAVATIVNDIATVGPAVRERHAPAVSVAPTAEAGSVGLRITPTFRVTR